LCNHLMCTNKRYLGLLEAVLLLSKGDVIYSKLDSLLKPTLGS
jgi:hypothetical protein